MKSTQYDVSKSVSNDLDCDGVVLKNTIDNEFVNVYRRSAISPPAASVSSNDSNEAADREIPFVLAHATTKVRPHSDHVSPVNASPEKTLKSHKTSSTKTSVTSSEASTPLDDSVWRSMLSGENLGVNHRPLSSHFSLQLPDLIPSKEDESDASRDDSVRSVTLTKAGSDDKHFGLLVRRGVKNGKPVLFVESASVQDPLFVPGDQLVAVHDVDVEEKDRDEVIQIFNECAENQITLTVRR